MTPLNYLELGIAGLDNYSALKDCFLRKNLLLLQFNHKVAVHTQKSSSLGPAPARHMFFDFEPFLSKEFLNFINKIDMLMNKTIY
jgi:hypothetical protein